MSVGVLDPLAAGTRARAFAGRLRGGRERYLIAAICIAICVVMLLASRYAWPRYTAIALEALAAASTLIPLFAGAGPGSLLGAIIPLLLVRELSHEDVAAWCNK